MALEIGSDDRASGVPSYQEYVVASRLNSAVAFDDITTAMADVRARELAGDDGMMVMGYNGGKPSPRLYRQRDGFTELGTQILAAELEEQRTASAFAVRQQGFTDVQDQSGNAVYLAELAEKNPTLNSAEVRSAYLQGVAQQQPEGRNEEKVQLDQEWFERHSFHIREANTVAAYAPEEMAVAQAYWSGQRDLFNSVREDAITVNPSRAKDLPAAIEFDEIRVRQQIQEPGQSLELAL
jgi:hypothetical protein